MEFVLFLLTCILMQFKFLTILFIKSNTADIFFTNLHSHWWSNDCCWMQVAVAHEGPRSKRFWGATGCLAVDPCSWGVRGVSRASRVSAIWAVTATSTKASLPAKDSPPPGPPSAPNTHVPMNVKSKTNFNFFFKFYNNF